MNCLTVFDYFVGLALKGLGLMIFSILQRNCNHLVHKQTLSNLAKLYAFTLNAYMTRQKPKIRKQKGIYKMVSLRYQLA